MEPEVRTAALTVGASEAGNLLRLVSAPMSSFLVYWILVRSVAQSPGRAHISTTVEMQKIAGEL